MRRTDRRQTIRPTKGRNLPATLKKDLVIGNDEFPLNLSPKLSFVRWFVLLPFVGNLFMSERNQEFLVLDYLIFGDNPALNAILLRKILDKAIFSNQTITVGVVSQTGFDYWGYHYYKKNELAFRTLLEDIGKLEHPLLNIIQIGDNFDVAFHRQHSGSLGNYCFFLKEKLPETSSIEMAMPSLAEAQRRLKQSLLWEVSSVFRKLGNFQQLMFSKPKGGNFNHIICNNVFFTSYQPWLNHEVDVASYSLRLNEKENIAATATLFYHQLFASQSLGSAYHIPNSFEYLEDFVEVDLHRAHRIII